MATERQEFPVGVEISRSGTVIAYDLLSLRATSYVANSS
jgi:hypothetical protein